MFITVTNIVWDTEDNGEILSAEELGLPCEVEIEEHIDHEDIADYLSDEYGYCIFSFECN